jgi:hypothetical protein
MAPTLEGYSMNTYNPDSMNENANERVAYTRGLRHGRAAQSLGVVPFDAHALSRQGSAYTRGYARGYAQARLTQREG